MKGSLVLPGGYRLEAFESLDSTNAEALRRAQDGAPGGLWVWSLAQTAGRGRTGRIWDSLQGNLHATLLLRPSCTLDVAVQLAFVAGLAAYDCVSSSLPAGDAASLKLKWPNDLLLKGLKLGGILIESARDPSSDTPIVVIGTGINLAAHPNEALRPATDLASHGIVVPPAAMLERLAAETASWLIKWDEGRGFGEVRAAWEARALALGHPIRVRLEGGEEEGLYGGIDARGALRLVSNEGAERLIAAGDVFVA